MKEAPKNYPGLIFQETFRDEQTVRKNGGVPTDVSFKNGCSIFGGDGYITNNRFTANNYTNLSFRAIFKPSKAAHQTIISQFSTTGVGWRINTRIDGNSIWFQYNDATVSNKIIHITDGYVNNTFDIVVTWDGAILKLYSNGVYITSISDSVPSRFDTDQVFSIGKYSTDSEKFNGNIDLVEIYDRVLSVEEVSNLYNNKWNNEQKSNKTLLDFDSTNGVIEDRVGNDLEITDVEIKKQGALFNGSTSKIDTGTDMIGTKAVTVMGWVKPYSCGENKYGRILGNGKIFFYTNQDSNSFYCTSNVSRFVNSLYNTVIFNKWQFVSFTRKADGKVSFYIGDKDTAPVLSGSADQNSGTPVVGTTNVIIGNKNDQTRTFDGLISKLKIVEGILDLDEITQVWSETVKEIK